MLVERRDFYYIALHKSIVLIAGVLLYTCFSLSWIPDGLNFHALRFLSLLLWPVLVVLFISLRFFKPEQRERTLKANTYDIGNLILGFLPMTPIFRFILANHDILSSSESIFIFCLFLLITLVYAYFIPALLNLAWAYLDEFTILGLSFTFSLFFTPYLSSSYYFCHTLLVPLCIVFPLLTGLFVCLFDRKLFPLILCAILLLGISFFLVLMLYLNSSYYSNRLLLMPFSLFLTFLISYAIYSFNPKLLRVMVAVLFLTTIFNAEIFTQGLNSVPKTEKMNSKIQALAKNRQMIAKPDIFLLTYESYVCNETMLKYGLDNSDQESYLSQKGFTIYPGIYTIGPASAISMNAVLDISSDEKAAQEATSGNGNVQRLFQAEGYETYGIFPFYYFFWGKSFDYDYCFPTAELVQKTGASTAFVASILKGEFWSLQLFSGLAYSAYVSKKLEILALPRQERPRFVYTHNRYPGHSIHGGKIIVGDEFQTYKLGLQKANIEMKNDVEALLKSNPDSIIIINGDHGPRLLEVVNDINDVSRINIQDQYGVFLAIKWPENLQSNDNTITVLQDVFPVILDALFKTTEFSKSKIEPKTLLPEVVAGAIVNNGVIIGGKDDGKPLFESSNLFAEPE